MQVHLHTPTIHVYTCLCTSIEIASIIPIHNGGVSTSVEKRNLFQWMTSLVYATIKSDRLSIFSQRLYNRRTIASNIVIYRTKQ